MFITAGLAMAMAMTSVPCCAQQDATSELKVNPLVAMREFEPAADQEYELGPGDEISIDFGGRPELNSKRIVGPDGRVTLPLAGAIVLVGKTREQAADTVIAALAPYYSNLSVTVGVDRYTSNRILLLGSVERPGVLSFDQPPTLLEVLTRGGGGSGDMVGSGAFGGNGGGGGNYGGGGSRGGHGGDLPERAAIYRGKDKVVWVNVKAMLTGGTGMTDLRLKRDDVVYVPSPADTYVSVLGQVVRPGALELDSTTTLAKLIAEAGGLTAQAGKSPDIRVYQSATGVTRTIPFKAVLGPGKLDLTLHSGDVVLVTESGFNQASYVLQQLSPLVTIFTAAAFFNR